MPGLQTSALRLIQRTLLRLWESRREGFLTNAAYESIGGVGPWWARSATPRWHRIPATTTILDRVLSRLVFLDIVTVAQAAQAAEGKSTERRGGAATPTAVPVKDIIPAVAREHVQCRIDQLTNAACWWRAPTTPKSPASSWCTSWCCPVRRSWFRQLNQLSTADREFLLWRQRFGLMITRGEEIKGKALKAARDWLQSARRSQPGGTPRDPSAVRERRTMVTLMLIGLGVLGFFGYRGWQKAAVERERAAMDQARTTVANADYLAGASRWQEAIDSLNAVGPRYEFQDSLHLKRGRAFAAQDATEQAIQDFTRAYQLNPVMIEALVERGDAHAAAGNYPGAMADYEEALRRNPSNSAALLGRGDARISLKGSPDSSLADFTASFKPTPAGPRRSSPGACSTRT